MCAIVEAISLFIQSNITENQKGLPQVEILSAFVKHR